MANKFKNFIKSQFSYNLWHFLISNYQSLKFLLFKKYSARGNIDQSLINIINKKKGFYFEIGAYNGISESISLRFENDLKWSGLLIEPNPFYLLKAHGRIEAYQEVSSLGAFVKKFGSQGEWKIVASHFVDYWNGDGAWDSLSEERQVTLTNMVKPNFHEWDAVLDGEDDILKWQGFLTRMLIIKGSETKRAISEIVELLAISIPGLKVWEVPGCGHMLPISHPHLVNPIIEEFLGR